MLAVGGIRLSAAGAHARVLRRVALILAFPEIGPRGAAMAGCAALLAALAPRARLLLPLALAPEHGLRQRGPARAGLGDRGLQRLDAGGQRRPLGLQLPDLGAQLRVPLAQRGDQGRGPRGRRPQPLVALAQPGDRAIPGLQQACGRRVPPVELLVQRRDLVEVLVRRLAHHIAQPGDVLLQPIDLFPVVELEPLDVVVGLPQRPAEIFDFALKEPGPAPLALRRPRLLLQPGVLLAQRGELLLRVARSPGSRTRPGFRRRRSLAQPSDLVAKASHLLAQGHDRAALARLNAGFRKQRLQPRHFGLQGEGALRRAADFLDLGLCRLQLGPAGVELRLQRPRPGARGHLRPAQLLATRFGRIGPSALLLI